MPAERSPFQYTVLRVVPRLERGEYINAGVVLFARTLGFLDARIGLDEARLTVLAPGTETVAIARQLDELAQIARGGAEGGPIAALAPSERFHWLAAPSSTVIQPSPVHTGLCDDPAAALERLAVQLLG